MIRDLKTEDKEIFISMMRDFYSSPAVNHAVDPVHFHDTFNSIIKGSPFTAAYIIESSGKTAGYALLSFTHSNEAGGMVVLIEEIYILEEFRKLGLANNFFEFIHNKYKEAKRFRLEITPENEPAIKLYRKLGYKALHYIPMIKDINY